MQYNAVPLKQIKANKENDSIQTQYFPLVCVWLFQQRSWKRAQNSKTDVTKPNFTVSPLIDIKKRKCSRNCIHVVMWRILILSWYIKQSLSVYVLLCYKIKSLDWDLRMRVIHDIIACCSEIYSSMLFSRYKSDTLISQFTTFSS